MVMEMPSPQCVGQEFVRQYYTLLHQAPEHMHRFYSHDSSFVHGGIEKPGEELPPVMGQAAIHKKIMSLNFRDCHAKIRQVDSQSTIDKAVVVQVAGELSNAGQPMRRFMQTFILAPQSPKKYYVHNDIFRYQDEVFHDIATDSEPDAAELEAADEYEADASDKQVEVNCEQQLETAEQVSNGSVCPTASIEPEVKLSAREPGAVREAEVSVSVGESVNTQKLSAEGEMLSVSSSVSEDVHQSDTATVQHAGTVTAASLLPQSVLSASPSTSAETKVLETPKQVSWAALASKNMTSAVVQGSGASQPKPQATVKPEVKSEATPTTAPLPQRVPRSEQRISVDRDSGVVVGTATGDGEDSIRRPRYADNVQIFVGNLPHVFTDHDLRDYFEKFGAVIDVRVNRRGPTRDVPNFGFVVFESPETVQKVLEQKPLFIMDGKYRLNVEEKRQQGVGGPVRGSPRGSYRGYPSSRSSTGRGGWRGRGRGVRSYGPGRSSDDDNSGDEPLPH